MSGSNAIRDNHATPFTLAIIMRNINMKWTTPAFEDLRLGFEINLYINNR
jgi:coenzyme PQQ precursor peptide PqqA